MSDDEDCNDLDKESDEAVTTWPEMDQLREVEAEQAILFKIRPSQPFRSVSGQQIVVEEYLAEFKFIAVGEETLLKPRTEKKADPTDLNEKNLSSLNRFSMRKPTCVDTGSIMQHIKAL